MNISHFTLRTHTDCVVSHSTKQTNSQLSRVIPHSLSWRTSFRQHNHVLTLHELLLRTQVKQVLITLPSSVAHESECSNNQHSKHRYDGTK